MRVKQGMVDLKAGILSSCEITRYFVCHAQKFILKAMKKYEP